MSSRTTIQLDRKTKEILERIKRETKARNYAEVIRSLAKASKVLSKSDRGSLTRLESFQREKIDRFD